MAGPLRGQGTHRRQDLGLRDDAVGEAVLSALSRDLGPRHLEASPGLEEVGLGHCPGEVPCDVHVVDHEGGRQVLGLGGTPGMNVTCTSRKREKPGLGPNSDGTRPCHRPPADFWQPLSGARVEAMHPPS